MTMQGATMAETLIKALGLPDNCRVDQRVPKKLLAENGAPTAADRRLINDGIEEIQWVAVLKPNTVGVAVHQDAQREYLEIAVLTVTVRAPGGKPPNVSRITELVHRAIPYPVFLLLDVGTHVELSLVHKRWAQNEAGKVILDGDIVSVDLYGAEGEADVATGTATPDELTKAFLQALTLSRQTQTSLLSLYLGWMDCVHSLLAARQTGTFRTNDSAEQAAACRQALQDCQRLEAEAAKLRALALKEKQLARRVELNLALQRVQAQLAAAQKRL